MGAKEILNRLKKMESSMQKTDNITVIYLLNGVKKKKCMSMREAQEQIMEQTSRVFFGKECDMNNCIVGVEYEGSDGFLEYMLETQPVDPEEMMRIVDDGGEMAKKSIIARLEELEKNCGSDLPLVKAKYLNGDVIDYYGLPPIDDLFRDENPIMKTYGSEFADMVNSIMHPFHNRNIEDFEGGPKWRRFYTEPEPETVEEATAPPQTMGSEIQQLIRQQREEKLRKDKERENKADIAKRAFAKRERIGNS